MEKEILNQVAKEFNLPKKTIEDVYKEWIYYIINTIESLDCNSYNKQPSFTIPSLGKLVCDKFKLERINNNKNGRIKFKENTSKE